MTHKTITIFIGETHSNAPKKNDATNKTDDYHLDDIWSADNLDLKGYGSENKRGYRYVLVVIDDFCKFGWTIPLKKKNVQTVKDSFKNIIINSKIKQNLIKKDREMES